jgi:hypothetical protein
VDDLEKLAARFMAVVRSLSPGQQLPPEETLKGTDHGMLPDIMAAKRDVLPI